MSQEVGLLHIYAWRRDGGPFYIGGPSTVEDGIKIAEDALKDPRRGFLRAEIKDIRAMQVLWSSAPVLRPGGVK